MGEETSDCDLQRYEAVAFCENCQYAGPVNPLVGQPVWTELCPVCKAAHVMPIAAPIARRALGLNQEDE